MAIPNAVAVFCASSPGNQPAFTHAAESLGFAIAKSGMAFVYGGGNKGIMGVVSGAALQAGAHVTGIVPYAMVKDGKEVRKVSNGANGANDTKYVVLNDHDQAPGMKNAETIVVHSMHERKVEMAQRVRGFFGLPGGFGTFEELMEVTTWSQIGLHEKPVVVLNVLGFYNPLRDLIQSGVRSGFIQSQNEGLVVFVDGPPDLSAHETFDWGTPALEALNNWRKSDFTLGYDWKKTLRDKQEETHTSLDRS